MSFQFDDEPTKGVPGEPSSANLPFGGDGQDYPSVAYRSTAERVPLTDADGRVIGHADVFEDGRVEGHVTDSSALPFLFLPPASFEFRVSRPS